MAKYAMSVFLIVTWTDGDQFFNISLYGFIKFSFKLIIIKSMLILFTDKELTTTI